MSSDDFRDSPEIFYDVESISTAPIVNLHRTRGEHGDINPTILVHSSF
jgi:hypothetical protein